MKSSHNDSFREFPGISPGEISNHKRQVFRHESSLWDWIQSDSILRDELEMRMSERVNARVETLRRNMETELRDRALEIQSSAERTGRDEGFEFGRKEGCEIAQKEKRPELDAVIARLSSIVENVLVEKDRILASHETQWIEALEYILVHCLVPREEEVVRAVRSWLDHELKEFQRLKAVTLWVAVSQFADYQAALLVAGPQDLVLRADESLESGAIRVECDNGGILFSDREALERLRETIRSVVRQK